MDVTQAYSKIINSIKEAEEAAEMADRNAQDALEVRDTPTYLSRCLCVQQFDPVCVCVCVGREGPGPRSKRRISEEPQSGAEGRGEETQ